MSDRLISSHGLDGAPAASAAWGCVPAVRSSAENFRFEVRIALLHPLNNVIVALEMVLQARWHVKGILSWAGSQTLAHAPSHAQMIGQKCKFVHRFDVLRSPVLLERVHGWIEHAGLVPALHSFTRMLASAWAGSTISSLETWAGSRGSTLETCVGNSRCTISKAVERTVCSASMNPASSRSAQQDRQ
jgi:hypothetical protein